MQMDTALNITALVSPVIISYWAICAGARLLAALERREHLARLAHKPFHPRMLTTLEQHAAVGASGRHPDEWHADLAYDAIKGRRATGPTWLDYVQEFQPETLERRPRDSRLRRLRVRQRN